MISASKKMPKKKPKTIDPTDLEAVIRQAIIESGRSVNSIALESGVSQGSLSRFMRAERTLTLPAASLLFKVLDLTVQGRH